jgi:RHS repeat-associated protein
MTLRAELSGTQRITFTQQFNVENRLVAVTNTVSGQVTQFTYDGDGNRVKKVQSGVTTAFVGNAYEWTSTSTVKYYYLGGKRVALRTAAGVIYLHGDHLGSASLTTGAVSSSARYYPYGGDRWTSGSMPTDYKFTGQRQESGFGLYDYGARYYDPLLGRFVSADSVVPGAGNPQAFNRYSYVNNNPLKYVDPSGHDPLGTAWRLDFEKQYGRSPDASDELIYLFILAYPDEAGAHTFYNHDGTINTEAVEQIFRRKEGRGANRTWDTMPDALSRLSRFYKANEKAQFVRDVGLLWAGLRARSEDGGHLDAHWLQAQIHQNAYLGPGSIDPSGLTN